MNPSTSNGQTNDQRPHPLQAKIYGEECVDEKFIDSNGMGEPIVTARLSFNNGETFENYIMNILDH
jgi:hypothetical protein